MKNFLLIFFTFLIWNSSIANAQCPSGNVSFSTQSEINNFKISYPSCTNFQYDILINGSNITSLAGLSNLESISGKLTISNNSVLTSLSGLSALKKVGGILNISSNPVLVNVNGLSSFTNVEGGAVFISYNPELTNLSGLSSLVSIKGNFDISNNYKLTNLNGLSALQSINGALSISDNWMLTNISGLSNITPTTITSLSIADNPLLSVCDLPNFCTYLSYAENDYYRYIVRNGRDCNGFLMKTTICPPVICHAPNQVNIITVTGATSTFSWNTVSNATAYEWMVVTGGANPYTATPLKSGRVTNTTATATGLSEYTLYDFYVKTDCGAEGGSVWSSKLNFTTNRCPSGDLTFTSQSAVDNFKVMYPVCTSITGSVNVSGSTVTNLNGLSNLTNIGGLTIWYTNTLAKLDGLSSLTNISGSLSIQNNSLLTDISGLSGIPSGNITSLKITSNPLLSICNLPNFCTFLSKSPTTHPREIRDNLGSCSNEAAIAANCPVVCDSFIPTDVSVTTVNSSGATFGWNTANHATAYDWIVIETWGNPATSQPLASGRVNGTIANATDLSEYTSYDFYVRTVCGPDNESQWSNRINFTTTGICPTPNTTFNNQEGIDNFKINYPTCTQLQGNVSIVGYAITNLDGLSNITSISGSLSITYSNYLTTLDGLSSLTNIGGELNISYNTALTHLNGLSSLTSINSGRLSLYNNSVLSDITGLSNINSETIGHLDITSNPLLSVCNFPEFCKYLSNPNTTHSRTISRNAAGCLNTTVIIAACNPCSAIVSLTSPTDDYSLGIETKKAKAINGKINASNKISNTARINYEAASIELLSGFQAEAKNGAVFTATVGGCN